MIQASEIFFRYPQTSSETLKNISLQIKSGEIFGILGPNGAGKTTLLKIFSRLLPYQTGEVFLKKQPLNSFTKKEFAKLLGYVAQDEEVFLPFTVEQIVLMGRAPYLERMGFESKEDREISEQAMVDTNIIHFKKRSIGELSGGERQRVFIARALAQKTPLLILDEPTSHLDIHFQMEIMELLTTLNQSQKLTIILTLHDVNLASLFCHRLLFLKEGHMAACGKPEDIIHSENLFSIFGLKTLVNHHDSGKPYYLPLRK